jgi:hypothetical protein
MPPEVESHSGEKYSLDGHSLAFEHRWTSKACGCILDRVNHPFHDVEEGRQGVSNGTVVHLHPKIILSRPDHQIVDIVECASTPTLSVRRGRTSSSTSTLAANS